MAGLLDKVVVGINKGVTTVSANSKAMVEKAKVKTAIGSLEKEQAQLVQQLGQKVFEMHENTGEIAIEEITHYFLEIRQRIEQIKHQNELLVQIEEEVNRITRNNNLSPAYQQSSGCACGQINPEGAKFCAGCGSKL